MPPKIQKPEDEDQHAKQIAYDRRVVVRSLIFFLSIGFPLLCQTLFGQPMWKRRVFLVSSTLSAYAASLAMRGGPDSLEHIYGNCIVVVIFPPCCHFKKSTFNCEFLCVQSRVIV